MARPIHRFAHVCEWGGGNILDCPQSPDASVNVWYKVKLYEGVTEETGDLEDTETGTINVPRNQMVPLDIRLVNTEYDGGDTSDINLQIINNRQP